ncbi:MAG: magnesium/cobalt transporter CorA [Desulfobacterales bacterium]|nr:magnesium/cobalt transporter CorA [Desulfobacterales bacterium]
MMKITCIDYSPEEFQIEDVLDISDFISKHRPVWSQVRWINVDELTHAETINDLVQKYQLHPLAIEDVLNKTHRPKIEDYLSSGDLPGRLFIVARSVELHDNKLQTEKMCFFLGQKTVFTFQEIPGDNFDSIRNRIKVSGSRLRQHDASFLLYMLLDAIVDSYFPIMEYYSDKLEEIEEEMLAMPNQKTLKKLHYIKHQLLILRRTARPMRDIVSELYREQHECLSEISHTYFRDVYDHCIQIIELIETYREIASSLTEMYMSAVSNRMNEIMKVLTMMGTIFIPLTFLAGVYGMNMPIPENNWAITYPIFWLLCIVIALVMLFLFRRKHWI